ncbi:MAG: glycosyl hydrolase family 43 [Candidatus Binatia bacterium]|nr:glycosyl hydrolase family 43 [Candidatus Binatia bacterium]
MNDRPFYLCFRDHPANPIIEPPRGTWLIGDPTIVPPDDSPDSRWHLFCNTLTAIHHYVSDDGIHWQKQGGPLFRGIRGCVRRWEGRFFLFYETFLRWRRRGIAVRSSLDLRDWSAPRLLLEPEHAWEGTVLPATSNPCAVRGEFGFRLYYSAANVVLWDTWVVEPRYISVAEADHVQGPYRKLGRPILAPAAHDRYANLGAGAIKVYASGKSFLGFQNGIYRDDAGRSRSAIRVLQSADGIAWEAASPGPILAPTDHGWKRAFVYQLEVVRYRDEYRLYYNARDGWRRATERIGVAVAPIDDRTSD